MVGSRASHSAGKTVVIPAEPEGKVLAVRGSVAPDCQVRLVLDTGAGTSALSLACAERLGLVVHRGLRVHTPTGLTGVGYVRLPSLRVGPLEVTNLRLAAVPLPNERIDGLLGLDFFRAMRATTLSVFLTNPARLEVLLPV